MSGRALCLSFLCEAAVNFISNFVQKATFFFFFLVHSPCGHYSALFVVPSVVFVSFGFWAFFTSSILCDKQEWPLFFSKITRHFFQEGKKRFSPSVTYSTLSAWTMSNDSLPHERHLCNSWIPVRDTTVVHLTFQGTQVLNCRTLKLILMVLFYVNIFPKMSCELGVDLWSTKTHCGLRLKWVAQPTGMMLM